MVKVRPFAAIRPAKGLASEVAAPPYDVLDSAEAKALAGEKSLLHITKAEIDFDPIPSDSDPEVYARAVGNFKSWQERGWLRRDPKPCYYIYSQTMDGRTQYGIVLCACIEDYADGHIKKHELTRKDKEDDRMIHVRNQNANLEPVFFSFKDNDELNAMVDNFTMSPSEYAFTDENGFGHEFWVIDDDEAIERISAIFSEEVESFYIADGHHRTAAAARVGQERKEADPNHTGEEEYNYFMAVCFPESQLAIMDYNRVVKDLAGLSEGEFLSELSKDFEVECIGGQEFSPDALHVFSMYLGGRWYRLKALEGRYDDCNPIAALDVTVLSKFVLDRILGIKDLRTDRRIDFVGGIRGLGVLKERVDSGEMKVAFALYPVSMSQLTDIADSGKIMPPKTTWFEPKLRSGLAIHTLD